MNLLEAAQNAIENEVHTYQDNNPGEPIPTRYACQMASQNAFNYADQYGVDPNELRSMIEELDHA